MWKNTTVTIYTTNGDGNCLFRAIKLGLTHSHEAHHLIRNNIINIINYLLDTNQAQNIENIVNMGRVGV